MITYTTPQLWYCNKIAHNVTHQGEELSQLLALILFYREHLKVVWTISSDYEAVFKSYSSFLDGHGANYRVRIPGEHEVEAER
jgi:hypothetical protein